MTDPDTDPGGPKTYGSGAGTLPETVKLTMLCSGKCWIRVGAQAHGEVQGGPLHQVRAQTLRKGNQTNPRK
jgi:hypothetical protein